MKYLADYVSGPQTELFDRIGAFFAFSTKQFNEARKEGVQYVQGMLGMIYPKGKGQELMDGIDRIHEEGVKQDIKENGKENIIKRELSNHECYYTGDISDCVDRLDSYGITADEINTVFRAEWAKQA